MLGTLYTEYYESYKIKMSSLFSVNYFNFSMIALYFWIVAGLEKSYKALNLVSSKKGLKRY